MGGGRNEVASGVHEGDVIAAKYRVEKVLGSGGMGVVVAARHVDLNHKVAIKFLLPEMLWNPEAVARFAREARAAVQIKSEHVARVIDVGTLETGAPYIVMEFLDGVDLAQWVQERGALPVEQAIEFVLHACEALAEAHGLGIVHRDLKPANLFIVRGADGLYSAKVLDFGISKIASGNVASTNSELTRTTAKMGSPLYMSPEQMTASRDADSRSDIWALGIILYELVSGKLPFDGEALPEVCIKIATQAPQPLRALRPDIPTRIEATIFKCLEKDRNRRYGNVAELAMDLAEFGPRRARASADRISRVIKNAGLSSSALALPPSSDRPFTPPAFPSTQASWGQTTAGPTVRIKAEVGAEPELESDADPSTPRPARARPVRPAVHTSAGRLRVVSAVAGAIVVGGLGSWLVMKRAAPAGSSLDSAPVTIALPPAEPVPPPPPPEPKASATQEPVSPTSPTAAPPRATNEKTPTPPKGSLRKKPQPPASTASVASVTSPPPPPAPSVADSPSPTDTCDPPFIIDGNGIEHVKPGCL
jgi:eukaryotic-like serine/threonine-protein kinase